MEPPISELMALFAEAWRQLGRHLNRHFHGSFSGMVESAARSAVTFTTDLSKIDYFSDTYRYHGMEFPFLKRAQLACYDLSLSLADDRRCQFKDLDQLTIFADNLVPHVLKVDGVLVFHDDLEGRIERGELIPPGSDEEIKIRALAVFATERLTAFCNAAGDPVMPLQLSDWLWNRGLNELYKARPRHRSRSVHY